MWDWAAAPGADNNDPDVMNVDTVDAENNTETFAAERTISRIVENLVILRPTPGHLFEHDLSDKKVLPYIEQQ